LSKDERWYSWQIVTLLLLTNSVKDNIVKDIVEAIFSRFPDPLAICDKPSTFLDFLTSNAKDFIPLERSFDRSTDGIAKSPNYCYQKARYIVAMSKRVVILWCQQHISTSSLSCWKTLQDKYCNTTCLVSLCEPLPRIWLKKCAGDMSTLFPKEYSESFFSALPGIGLKMRHLCAEAIYDSVVGPAIDCHCIRFCIEMGTIHASMNLKQTSDCLIAIYRNDQLVDLNELPASISQIMSSLSATTQFAAALLDIGKLHQLEKNMEAFLRHYSRPQ
jgi:hypothetical protein